MANKAIAGTAALTDLSALIDIEAGESPIEAKDAVPHGG